MPATTYRNLEVWKTAMDLVEAVYTLSGAFPSAEGFGLGAQVRRAAVSIPANIAEGYGRRHRGDYLHHLSFARGSLMELETHLLIAVRLQYADRSTLRNAWVLSQQVGKMLNRLVARLPETPEADRQSSGAHERRSERRNTSVLARPGRSASARSDSP